MSEHSLRKKTLDAAAQAVLQDRAAAYGTVENNFQNIANLWSVYLNTDVTPSDVASMMTLLKVARLMNNPSHFDSWVDIAGYAACGGEVSHVGKANRK